MTTITLTDGEVKVLVEEMNGMVDDGVQVINSLVDATKFIEVRPFLRKLLVAGLKSGALKLPTCFTGDQELMDAAAEGNIARKFEETFPDPTTKH